MDSCDRLLAAGGHSVLAHALVETFSILTGGRLHLAAARKAGAQALVTLDARDFDALARPGDPHIAAPGEI